MTNLSLLVAAGFGCSVFMSRPAVAQSNQILAFNATPWPNIPVQKPAFLPDDDLIHFCGENVPVNHPDLIDRWSRTLTHQVALAGHLAVLKRRASVVFPLIEPILKQYDIPSDFKYLPLLESAVSNRTVSRRGAAGFWQLMPGTAQSLGLSVSRKHDERFNLIKATHAACRYIHELYEQLGSWMLVATAYNAGPNYIQQLVRQHPDTHPMALPYRAAETRAYLFQTVVVKELLTHTDAYRDLLSSRHFAALSGAGTSVTSTERATILASFDMEEERPVASSQNQTSPTVPDEIGEVALLTEEESNPENQADVAEPDSVATPVPEMKPVETVAPVIRLTTRSLSEGSLAEGKLCMFQVVQPVTLNGRTFAVGDMIQAHIEIIDAASGRVFLRTDRLTTAERQESFPLTLVATGQPKHPGVTLPTRLDGWQLTWEAM